MRKITWFEPDERPLEVIQGPFPELVAITANVGRPFPDVAPVTFDADADAFRDAAGELVPPERLLSWGAWGL